VEIADNGEEVVKKAQLGSFHVILMDFQMPVVDGITATKQLRALGFKIPVLVFLAIFEIWLMLWQIIGLTANADDTARKEGLEAGMTFLLGKPIKGHLLKSSIEAALHASKRWKKSFFNLILV
jgi:CheY-like chemotaxis protein